MKTKAVAKLPESEWTFDRERLLELGKRSWSISIDQPMIKMQGPAWLILMLRWEVCRSHDAIRKTVLEWRDFKLEDGRRYASLFENLRSDEQALRVRVAKELIARLPSNPCVVDDHMIPFLDPRWPDLPFLTVSPLPKASSEAHSRDPAKNQLRTTWDGGYLGSESRLRMPEWAEGQYAKPIDESFPMLCWGAIPEAVRRGLPDLSISFMRVPRTKEEFLEEVAKLPWPGPLKYHIPGRVAGMEDLPPKAPGQPAWVITRLKLLGAFRLRRAGNAWNEVADLLFPERQTSSAAKSVARDVSKFCRKFGL